MITITNIEILIFKSSEKEHFQQFRFLPRPSVAIVFDIIEVGRTIFRRAWSSNRAPCKTKLGMQKSDRYHQMN